MTTQGSGRVVDVMMAITIRQPWAGFVFDPHPSMGCMDVENRRWRTSYRGRLAIHAAASLDSLIGVRELERYRDDSVAPTAWARGFIVGTVTLLGVCPLDRGCAWCSGRSRCDPVSDWPIDGMWHWHLGDPRLLERPVPATGSRHLWEAADTRELASHAAL